MCRCVRGVTILSPFGIMLALSVSSWRQCQYGCIICGQCFLWPGQPIWICLRTICSVSSSAVWVQISSNFLSVSGIFYMTISTWATISVSATSSSLFGVDDGSLDNTSASMRSVHFTSSACRLYFSRRIIIRILGVSSANDL